MTFKDFMVECTMYSHSKEHYDLVKECGELQLMEQYVSDQQFMLESAPIIAADSVILTEGYFSESADNDTITGLMEATDTKKKGIMTKIANGFKKILQTFITFCKKLYNQFDAVTRQAQEALSGLRAIPLTAQDITEIQQIEKGVKKEDKNVLLYTKFNQPFAGKLKLKYSPDYTGDQKTALETFLSVVLSNTTVRVQSYRQHAAQVGAVDISTLSKACKGLIKARKKYDIDSVAKLIESAYTDATSNAGLEVLANNKYINNAVTDMEEMLNKIDEMSKVVDEEASAEMITRTNELYTKLIGCVGNTMALYTHFINFRKACVTKVLEFVASKKPAAAASAPKDGGSAAPASAEA